MNTLINPEDYSNSYVKLLLVKIRNEKKYKKKVWYFKFRTKECEDEKMCVEKIQGE